MKPNFSFPNGLRPFIPLVIALILILEFALIAQGLFFGDEGIYAIAVRDFQQNGVGPHPTYFGEEMLWKPPLVFAVYAVSTAPLIGIVPDEIALRLPSLILMALSAVMVYRIFKDVLKDDRALIALALFLFSLPVAAYGMWLITDILAFFLMICTIYLALIYARTLSRECLLGMACAVFAAAFSKSIVVSAMAVLFALAYLRPKKLDIRPPAAALAIGAVLAFIAFYVIYPSAAEGDIARVTTIDNVLYIHANLLGLFMVLGPLVIGIIFAVKSIYPAFEFENVWALSTLALVSVSVSAVLPWYMLYFVPGLALVIAKEMKTKIDLVFVAILLVVMVAIAGVMIGSDFNSLTDQVEIARYMPSLLDNKTLVISRFGETVAYSTYNLKYGVMVAPQISMVFIQNGTADYVGVKNETLEIGNMRGLIYDYDNPVYVPKFTYMMSEEERYYPPIARTSKHWEGGFDAIVAEKAYAEAISSNFNEYAPIYTTKNGGFVVFMRGTDEAK